MSEPTLVSLLADYGLSENESKVYLHLSNGGKSKAGDIARLLLIPRSQVYDILKNLQEKGIVYSVPGRPIQFVPVDFSKSLNILIESQKQKQRIMQNSRQDVLSLWQKKRVEPSELPQDKFQFFEGMFNICGRATESIRTCKKELLLVSLEKSLYYLDRCGITDELSKLGEEGVNVRLLTEDTPRLQNMIAPLNKVDVHRVSELRISDMIIIDGKEMLLFIRTLESSAPKRVTAIWTDSEAMVDIIRQLFEQVWTKTETGFLPESELVDHKTDSVPSQEEMTKWLRLAGFTVKEKPSIKGLSGATHQFSLAITSESQKQRVIDIERSNDLITSMAVISFFAKQMDVQNSIAEATLLVDPGLDPEAERLARTYNIKWRKI